MTTTSRMLDIRTVRVLYGGVGVLALANILNHLAGEPFWTVTRLIDLGSDRNMAAWYSSVLLLAGAWGAVECQFVARERGRPGRGAFLVLAALLAFMSCDEIARFHEILGGLLASRVGLAGRSFAHNASWVWLLGPVVILIFAGILVLLRQALSQVPGAMRLFVLGFATVIAGGVILESTINWLNHDHLQALWVVEIWVEESMEMLGSILILQGLLVWRNGADLLPPIPS